MLGMNIQMPDYFTVHTPSTKIAVCTPSAPYVSKSNLELINTSLGRLYTPLWTFVSTVFVILPYLKIWGNCFSFRSLDTLTSLAEDSITKIEVDESISKSQEKLDVEANSESKLTPKEMKVIVESLFSIVLNIHE